MRNAIELANQAGGEPALVSRVIRALYALEREMEAAGRPKAQQGQFWTAPLRPTNPNKREAMPPEGGAGR